MKWDQKSLGMYLGAFFIGLFIWEIGRGGVFENQQDLDSFLVDKESIVEQKIYSISGAEVHSQNEAWLHQNFPDKCDWELLERVVDGDTVVLGSGDRVRMIGIDTPESKHPNKPVEAFSLEATAYLKSQISPGQRVCLLLDHQGDKVDKYDRILRYVFTEEGHDLNALMIQSGFAKAYVAFPFERKTSFQYWEQEARSLGLGRWEL